MRLPVAAMQHSATIGGVTYGLSATYPTMTVARRVAAAAALVAVAVLAGCGSGESGGPPKGGPGAMGPTKVGFVVMRPASVPVTTELAGRVVAFETAEVRPQVTGVVRRRFFEEGSIVRAGQRLYQIDPRLYAAALNEAQANVSSAQANQQAQRILADRYKPLAQQQAISQQDYTNAVASSRQATASVAQTRAQLETARINLRFTDVPAPITGRIGRSLFTVGALVTASQADPLTVIQRLDPIFVDIQQSSADLLSLRRALAQGGVTPTRARVQLRLEDGSTYGQVGSVEFNEVIVNQNTGTVTLRARFPNARGILFPGMFARASFAQGIDNGAFLVPQQAISRDPRGRASLFLVGPGDKAVSRSVTADRTQGPNWVVTGGLRSGDRVIVQGIANLRPGAAIAPVPAATPQRIAPPPQPGHGGPPAGGAPKAG